MYRPPPRPRLFSDQELFFLLVIHIPLVLAMDASRWIATAHALLVFGLGLSLVSRSRTALPIVQLLGYIAASEPLWRLARAAIFYESAKYMIVLFSVLALIRFRSWRQADKSALLYFLCFLPSILVLPVFDRREVSFNLSGPLTLGMCMLFLSTVALSRREFLQVILVMLAPILGFVFLASFSTVTTDVAITYHTSKIASAGLGQNQASSILGLGIVLVFLYATFEKRRTALRYLIPVIGVWCAGQATLTFSRGGLATAAASIAAASFFLLQDRRSRGAIVARLGMLVVVVGFVAFPLLDSFTGGALERRFSSTHLTGRDKLIRADFMAFQENPVFGVGPGQSKDYHARTFRRASTHTEYSRMLAEHGFFGVLALLTLGWMSFQRLRRPPIAVGKALASAFTAWALLFMFHAAMRMAAVSFIFALGAVLFLPEEFPLRRRRQISSPARTFGTRRARAWQPAGLARTATPQIITPIATPPGATGARGRAPS